MLTQLTQSKFFASSCITIVYIFWLILALFEHFIVNFSKSYPFKGARAGYVCLFWLDSSPSHWVDVVSDSLSTESTRNVTPHQLSQRTRHQHLWRFYHSGLTQLTWSLTPRWLSWRGVLLGIDSVNEEWDSASTESPLNVKKFLKIGKFKNKIEKIQKPYSLAYMCLIIAKNENKKISCKCTFNLLQCVHLPILWHLWGHSVSGVVSASRYGQLFEYLLSSSSGWSFLDGEHQRIWINTRSPLLAFCRPKLLHDPSYVYCLLPPPPALPSPHPLPFQLSVLGERKTAGGAGAENMN